MHARTIRMKVRDGQMDRVISLCKSYVIPSLEQQEGFVGFTLCVNHEQYSVLTFTLWEDEQQMEASETGEYLQDQYSRIIHLLTKPPSLTTFEVEHMT